MKYVYNFLIRYVLCFIPISLYELLLKPLTIYGVYYLLYFLNPQIINDIIIINGIPFTFIDACIATYAYALIIVLTLASKDIKLNVRIKIILLGSLLILGMNYFRIILLIILTVKFGFGMFNAIHLFFWKFLSWVYVAFVWVFLVKYFKVKEIPFYGDLKYLFRKSLFKKH